MCGIIGAIAQRNVVPILLEGLRRLEYRGYDSAGLVVCRDGALTRLRSVGRVETLAESCRAAALEGRLGIAHTRWATHGAPTEANAHPHVSGALALVHNGIIENHEALRQRLQAEGYVFTSETDTEVIAHLIHHHMAGGGDLLAAARAAVRELHGAYAIGVVHAETPGRLVCARHGSPLLIGVGIEEQFIASDVSALLPVTREVIHLEDGDVAELGLKARRIFDASGREADRPVRRSELSAEMAELGEWRHFMQKEIHEQPRAIADTLDGALSGAGVRVEGFGPEAGRVFAGIESVLLLACGTSHHAARTASYWIEQYAGLPASAEVASEYRYREAVTRPNTLVVAISQSGETADTLAALMQAMARGNADTLAICNVPESALVRAARLRFLTRAGPEIGVASTKAFTTQLVALFLLTLALAKARGRLDAASEADLVAALRQLPQQIGDALALEPAIAAWAERFADRHHALFLGRGAHYPIALEGALKLKEISYIHAEAYPAGELKHGPLALVDKDMPVVAIAPNDALLEKLKSNLEEVRARGGELYVFMDHESHIPEQDNLHLMPVTPHAGVLSPIVHVVPLQILAYHAALVRGTDVDKPRNLAKSVTVE